jgi:putative acetyltransferase
MYIIRPIEPRDEAQVAAIIRDVMTEFGASGPGYSIHDDEVDHMHASYTTPQAAYFIAEFGDRLVGGAGVAPLDEGEPGTCELKKMYMVPDVRGKGLGHALLMRSLDAARELGYTTCYLETLASMTDARRLYERAGFVKIDGPLGNTGHFSCDAFYTFDLTK